MKTAHVGCSALAAMLSLGISSFAAIVPPGTNLEVRLFSNTGSRISHAGDPVAATVIAPVFDGSQIVIPQGATIHGVVESVDRLGLGLKHRTATLSFRFDSVQIPDGPAFPIETRVREVETARERTTGSGDIGGIQPTANLSSGVSFAISAMMRTSGFAVPAIGIKFLIVRSPDPEIYFPAGTELLLESVGETHISLPGKTPAIVPLTPNETSAAIRLFENLPRQQASRDDRHSADLVNILLLGSDDEIGRSFRAAGWTGEQRHNALALFRMYHCLVQRMGYSTAPMTRLTLQGRAPDRVYQKSLDTFAKRHHIRLWNESGAWFGAATEDVAYKMRSMLLTHATDPQIDNERAKVVNDLVFTGCVSAASLLTRESLRAFDDTGHALDTDGSVAVLRMNPCNHPRTAVMPVKHAGPPQRILQAMAAIGSDFVRSNPVSLGYDMAKVFVSAARTSRVKGNDRMSDPYEWRRPSVIDASLSQLSAHNAHTGIDVKNISSNTAR